MSKKRGGRFIINLLYTENSSWQGEIVDAISGKKQNFRSAMEMIKLMDSAISKDEIVKVQ